ncbi:MAG: hypothetical protein PHW52_00910 [Candidatus Pacebacteria bacterium]|nr:hypothetical protein [Candidatus Paceibacterota bacterium]
MKSEKQNKGNNQTVILLAGAVILLLIVFAFLLMLKNKDNSSSNTNINPVPQSTGGYVKQRGNLMKATEKIWTLVYDKGGASTTVAITIDESTFCKKSGKPILCSQLQNGHRVDATGNLEGSTFTAKEIDLLDEITVEAPTTKAPQVQDLPKAETTPPAGSTAPTVTPEAGSKVPPTTSTKK